MTEYSEKTRRNVAVVGDWYDSLATLDADKLYRSQTDDVIYNVFGRTAVSGRWQGRAYMEAVIMPAIVSGLNLEKFQFSKRWKVILATDDKVVAYMEGEGEAASGKRYDNRYFHIFTFRDGRICELWEYFDTALAETVLFGNELRDEYRLPEGHGVTRAPDGIDLPGFSRGF